MNLSILNIFFHFREHFKILDFHSFLICFLIGWCLLNLVSLSINVVRYNPLRASSFIDLPKSIKAKQACINVQNNDNKCFLWAVLSAEKNIHWKDHPHQRPLMKQASLNPRDEEQRQNLINNNISNQTACQIQDLNLKNSVNQANKRCTMRVSKLIGRSLTFSCT